MKITERDTDHYHITIDDNELYCPIRNDTCMADRCAMAMRTEDRYGSNYYCGIVATKDNVAWNETGNSGLLVTCVKSVLRETV